MSGGGSAVWLWLWLLSSPARAGATDDLSACCRAVGATSCPSELFAVGPGSQQVPGVNGATTVKGGWSLRCEGGASFDPTRTSGARSVRPGAVVVPLDSAAAACFDVSCALPEGLCLRGESGGAKVVACSDGGEPSAGAWTNPARQAPGARVVGGRLLGADSPQLVSTLPAATPIVSTQPVSARIDGTVPPAPPMPCVPSAALRQPSNDQVDQGNDAVVAGDLGTAVDRYRAAISINRCNAFAWAALGDALLQAGNPGSAKSALQVATRLMPTHFHAWTRLGEANERLSDRAAAKTAFEQALAAHPGHPPATAGLGRTR